MALVITIIVLIILAGVSINAVMNGGLITNAKEAKSKFEQAKENELAELRKLEMIASGEQGLEDERLNNEKIKITSKEQVYALGRILLDDSVQSAIFTTYLTDGKFQEDLSLFEIPEEYTTDAEKVEYLRTTSYALENDITIKFDRTASYNTFFMGIGGSTKKFAGFFNGNEKNITIEGSDLQLNAYYDTLSIFGYTENAVIANMNVKISGDIKVLYNSKTSYIGAIAGVIIDTTIYNNNVKLEGTSIGVDYVENNQYYNSVCLSSLVGTAHKNSKIEKCTVNMTNNAQIYVNHNDDSKTNTYYFGLIVGKVDGNIEDRMKISNCNVNMQNAKAYAIVPYQGFGGGITGYAEYTDIENSTVTLKNSQIGVEGISNTDNLTAYYTICVGGFVGYGKSGSDNTANIGQIGVTIDSCSFNAENDAQIEVLYAKHEKGGAPNVGGIMAIAFNNAVINNCDVNLKNGIMIAQRTQEDTEAANLGATIGGIIGRLEHTGQVINCSANCENTKIIAKSTGKEVYCAGIVGVDLGPFHRNVISIENNKFLGNNSTSLELEVISGEEANEFLCVGGISGFSRYIMKNCEVYGTDIKYLGATSKVQKSYVGKIVGRIDADRYGLFADGTYFTPNEERGILGCSANNVNITVEGDDTTKVTTGDVYGVKY